MRHDKRLRNINDDNCNSDNGIRIWPDVACSPSVSLQRFRNQRNHTGSCFMLMQRYLLFLGLHAAPHTRSRECVLPFQRVTTRYRERGRGNRLCLLCAYACVCHACRRASATIVCSRRVDDVDG